MSPDPELVKWIVEYGSARKLLDEHQTDLSGHCPRCPSGGSSSGRVVGPCSLFLAAVAASKTVRR